ncbi:DUF4276 family protein [Xanthomonas oryzae pv. oryzicola]|uniref:DUF4276 family protein n=2 Tax=Xanthomonas oryzae TaxID=347 RepID=UPI003D185870
MPASASRRKPMICSSEKRFFTSNLLGVGNWTPNQGATQTRGDVADCRAVKQNLLGICRLSGKIQFCLVRIACTELETFYLADLAAVGMALQMSRLASHQNNRKFRSPDAIGNPSKELKLITGNRYQKVAGSREIGKYLQLDNARSASFRNLVTGVRRMETELLAIPV